MTTTRTQRRRMLRTKAMTRLRDKHSRTSRAATIAAATTSAAVVAALQTHRHHRHRRTASVSSSDGETIETTDTADTDDDGDSRSHPPGPIDPTQQLDHVSKSSNTRVPPWRPTVSNSSSSVSNQPVPAPRTPSPKRPYAIARPWDGRSPLLQTPTSEPSGSPYRSVSRLCGNAATVAPVARVAPPFYSNSCSLRREPCWRTPAVIGQPLHRAPSHHPWHHS